MSEKEKLEIELLKEVLARYEAEQKELLERYRNLDTKAQITIVASGIFITASGSLVKEVNNTLPPQINLFLACGILCLALSVTCAISVLLTKEVKSSPIGSGYLKLADDTLKFIEKEKLTTEQEIFKEYAINMRDQIKTWKPSITSYRDKCELKAQQLKCSQQWLLFGLIIVSFVTISSIFL
ncbi:hypothetical protein [Crocosphaera sp.]|uniref:hypothetical protein n=1 Tax=Crocosphaera sp. TaxID=2729996 RepID=UPI003F2194DC|nr:hypothetical protein [Crocosphaera sp.]